MIPTLIDHLLVIVLGLVLPFLSGIRGGEQMKHIDFNEATRKRFFISNSLVLAIMALIVMAIWFAQNRSWELMGFRKIQSQWMTWLSTAALCLMYAVEIIMANRPGDQLKKNIDQLEANVPFLPQTSRELPAYTLLCISAAVCEEIMYRGFLVTYFINPMKDGFPWIAVIFPAVLFSIAHFYQGYAAMGKIFILSALFGVIFIFSKSLIIVVIIHFLIDLLGGLMYKRVRN